MCVALLASSIPAAAAKPIKGKLSSPGYTVIALAEDGSATSVVANRGFSLAPPAKSVTLHLRGPDGQYAGPIVVGRKGKKAIMGVKAGAKLRKVKLRDGYAKLAKKLPKKELDKATKALAENKVPIGVGNFGRVASSASVPGGDQDLDGVPGRLDIDDDGDLTLDNLDGSPGMRSARGGVTEIFDLFTGLPLSLQDTANANAPGLSDEQIEAALPSAGVLSMEIIQGDTAELDCGGSPNPSPPPALVGGLAYCSSGGTGSIIQPGVLPADRPSFPDCCDEDGDGFGTLIPQPGLPGPGIFLSHGATTAQIGTGDVLIQRVTTGGVEDEFPTTLQFVFGTVPALVSYSDTAGNSTTVPYPVPSPSDPGTSGNGFPVAAGPDGDVVLRVTLWRPQRRPIPPETGNWIDIGGLTYVAVATNLGAPPGGTAVQKPCPQTALSEDDPNTGDVEDDPNLTLPDPQLPAPGFTDLAPDQPASPANTLSFTVNLTECLASLGAPSWDPGEELGIGFTARLSRPDAPDGAAQFVAFEQQP